MDKFARERGDPRDAMSDADFLAQRAAAFADLAIDLVLSEIRRLKPPHPLRVKRMRLNQTDIDERSQPQRFDSVVIYYNQLHEDAPDKPGYVRTYSSERYLRAATGDVAGLSAEGGDPVISFDDKLYDLDAAPKVARAMLDDAQQRFDYLASRSDFLPPTKTGAPVNGKPRKIVTTGMRVMRALYFSGFVAVMIAALYAFTR